MKEETLKPELAPKTKKMFSVKMRENMNRDDYSKILSQRSPDKLDKLQRIQREKEIKDKVECTFIPRINDSKKFLTVNGLSRSS